MIPTYECARFLEPALRSVLEQDLGAQDMEIVVVDDCSQRDDPEAVVRRVAGDRVRFVRQPVNVGHVRNFNACLDLARGQWIHLLHGDDLVLPGFYESVRSVSRAHPEVGAVLCRFWWADEAGTLDRPGWLQAGSSGVLSDWPARLAERQRLEAPSIVVRRSVYEQVGGFDEGVAGYGEDWEMWLRVAVHAPVWYDPRPMAVYRLRPGSLSDPSRLRQNMRDMRRVIGLNAGSLEAVLPAGRVRRLTRLARKQVGLAQLRRADNARLAGATVLPVAPVREALRMHPSPEVLARCVLLLVRSVRSRKAP